MKMEKDGDPAEILVLPPILLRLRPYQYGDPVAILAERAVLFPQYHLLLASTAADHVQECSFLLL